MSAARRPAVGCIGAGRLARALLPLVASAGYPVVAVASRRPGPARALCRRLPGARGGTDPLAAARGARLLLLAVPDGEIAGLTRALALAPGKWAGKTVLHHAGSLGVAPLRPLARLGAEVGVLHPLQALGQGPDAGARIPGSRARVEGTPRALRLARRLARDVGLHPFALPGRPTTRDRALYHAAASLVSNDLVALLAQGVDLLESLGLEREAALDALAPLAAGSLDRLRRHGPAAALTGPVARGDVDTVERQLRALSRRSRSAAAIHALLSERLLRLAEAEGSAPPIEARRRLRALLRAGLRTDRTV